MVRRGVAGDAAAILRVSLDAIRISAATDYTTAQLEAWCARRTLDGHEAMLAQTTVLVAERAGAVAGWVSVIDAECELDQLYVDPAHSGRGVARTLLAAADAAAGAAGCEVLETRASYRAAPVFAAADYTRVEEEVVVLDGERLGRFHMRKMR